MDRIVARRLGARDFREIDAEPRLEPLAIMIGQRNGRNRCAEQPGGEPGDPVEALARRCIEQPKIAQSVLPGLLVFDNETVHSL
jgi:hypothetical protein